jgi:homocysteine S-methyltransferase
MSRFAERLAEGRVIVGDGGTGALIAGRVPRLRCPEEANLKDPETVLAVHLAFVKAGSELIETNTFGANRAKLEGYLLDDRMAEIVERGVKIAREAREVSGEPILIGGSMGPLGDFEGRHAPDERFELFAEQARLLEGRGVDLFLVETFFDLEELVVAIEAVRSVSALPIVAQLSFDEGGETLAGVRAGKVIARVAELGVAAVGANCGLNPQAALEALAEMAEPARARGIPLVAQPNVGLPTRSGGRLLFASATPDYFAEFAAHARTFGARLIGGCCGSTPAQIAAIREAVEDGREPRVRVTAAVRSDVGPPPPAQGPTRLQAMLEAGEWVNCVELDPPKGANLEGLLATAALLSESGVVHAVDVNDNPMARARMSALVTSSAIQRATGLETIPHVTPRDSTVMGLQSQLLGAHAEGVRNILSVTGDPPSVGDYPGSHGVYEVDSIGLAGLLTRLNEGEDYAGRSIDAPTAFYVGVAVNPSADDVSTEVERFRRKVEAGARFGMTQPLFDLGYLDRFLDLLGGESPIPLLVGVWPLRSFQLAFRLHNEVPGIVVPDEVQASLHDAGADAAAVGLELARELYSGCRTRAAGVYVVPPFKEPEAALELLQP